MYRNVRAVYRKSHCGGGGGGMNDDHTGTMATGVMVPQSVIVSRLAYTFPIHDIPCTRSFELGGDGSGNSGSSGTVGGYGSLGPEFISILNNVMYSDGQKSCLE